MSLSPDQRFRLVDEYAEMHGFLGAFPNFHETDYGRGPVGGVHLVRDTVAEWRDVPRAEYGVFHIEDVPALFRGANDYAARVGYPAAFPNCQQADHGNGVMYGTVLIKPNVTEWRDIPRAHLGHPDIEDVGAMMTAAHRYAIANGFVAAFPTFHQAVVGGQVVYGLTLFKAGTVEWRDVYIVDLTSFPLREERTCVVLCRFRRDDGTLTDVPQPREYYRRYFLADGEGEGGLFDYYRAVTNWKLRVTGDVFGWFDIGHTLTEHRNAAGQAQRIQAYDWGVAAARANGIAVDEFPRRVVIVNTGTDFGGARGGMLVGHGDGSGIHHAYWEHEFGHVLGLDDSFGPGGRYQDYYCVMSAANTPFMAMKTILGQTNYAGPGLNGVYVNQLGGLPPSRITQVLASDVLTTVRLTAFGHVERDGHFLAEVPPGPGRPNTLWVELRHPSLWDQGIERPSVVVHATKPGERSSWLIPGPAERALRNVGDHIDVPEDPPFRALTFRLMSLGPSGLDAEVAIQIRPSERWSNYAELGPGRISAAPGACSWSANRIDVFLRGTDSRLWTASWNGVGWTYYVPLGTEEFLDNPAAVSWGPNRIDVFVRGADSALYTQSWDGASWTGSARLGDNLISAGPAACSMQPNSIDVFVRGTDGRLYTKSWRGGGWSDYTPLGPEEFLDNPAAVSWGPNRIDVFVRGTDNALYTKSWTGARWTGYSRLGSNAITAGPAASTWGPDRIDVFVRGTDRRLYTKSWRGVRWTEYARLGDEEFVDNPAAVSWGPDRIDVFVRGTDNGIYNKFGSG